MPPVHCYVFGHGPSTDGCGDIAQWEDWMKVFVHCYLPRTPWCCGVCTGHKKHVHGCTEVHIDNNANCCHRHGHHLWRLHNASSAVAQYQVRWSLALFVSTLWVTLYHQKFINLLNVSSWLLHAKFSLSKCAHGSSSPWRQFTKKPKAPSFQIGLSYNFDAVLQVNTHRLTKSDLDLTSDFQDDSYDIISCRKVLPSGECTHRICLAPHCCIWCMYQLPASNYLYSSWSIAHSFFLFSHAAFPVLLQVEQGGPKWLVGAERFTARMSCPSKCEMTKHWMAKSSTH